MKKILITGFEAFGGEIINPSYEAVKRLPSTILGSQIVKLEVPVSYTDSINIVMNCIKKHTPNIVILVGQAGGRKEISLERVAINIDDSNMPDNRGIKLIDTRISSDGDNAYFATLPIKLINDSLLEAKLKSGISNSAGTYLCNHLMYGILHYLIQNKLSKIKAGFIHVPYVNEQVRDKEDVFAMDLQEIVKALEIIVKVTLEVEHD